MLGRSRFRDRGRGSGVGGSNLLNQATLYLGGVQPFHWLDFINNRALYASVDVGNVTGATGYSFTRASDGYYTNSDGTLTLFGSGALRRGDRGVLIEGARTNLLLQSGFAGGGAAPTSWTQPVGTGTSAPATSTLNPSVVAYAQTATAERPMIAQSVTLANNTTYVLSVYVEAVTGTVALSSFLGTGALPSGASATEDGLGNLVAGQRRFLVISGTYTGAVAQMRVGLGVGANATGTVRFSMPQFEAGAFPSSYIPTVAASATRAADVLTYTAGVTYPIQLWSEFERAVDTNDIETLLCLDSGSGNDEALMYVSGDRLTLLSETGAVTQAVVQVASNLSVLTVNKGAVRVAADNFNSCSNTTLGTADTSGTAPGTPSRILVGGRNSAANPPFGYIRRLAIVQGAGTDAQLQSMTSG